MTACVCALCCVLHCMLVKHFISLSNQFFSLSCFRPSGQTGKLRRNVFNLSVYFLFSCQTCQHDRLKTNEPLMQIGTKGPRGNDMKQSTLDDRRLKVKGQGHTRPQIDLDGSFLVLLGRVGFRV